MKRFAVHLSTLVLITGFILSLPARAAVTVLHEWRLGENDSNSAPGAVATNFVDSVGTNTLAAGGAPVYSSDAAPGSSGSILSTSFTNGAYGIGPRLTNQDNFGMECWVKLADTNSTHVIAYNGNTSTSGWGLFADSGGFSVLYGGNAIIGAYPAQTNVWTDVAFVRTNGVTVLLINGVVQAMDTAAPSPPTQFFAIGTDPQNPATNSEMMNGLVDEVRVFAVTNGQVFSTNDLTLGQMLTVTSAADSGSNSLRGVIATAPVGALIEFSPGLSGQTIHLTNGPITLAANLRIDGSALTNQIQINGDGASRLFVVNSGVSAGMDSLTLTNAFVNNGNGGAISNNGTLTLTRCAVAGSEALGGDGGGAIDNLGILSASQCKFSRNTTSNSGGGGVLYNAGTASFIQCILSSNSCQNEGSGGAILNLIDGTLTLNQCLVSGNSATDPNSSGGGGIYSIGSLTVSQSTFASNNTAGGSGGGILFASGTTTVANSTFIGNSTSVAGGGAISSTGGGTGLLINCTIVSNTAAGNGGGIYDFFNTFNLTNCIVAENISADSNNITGAGVFTVDVFTGGDPLLAPLGYYGGFTPTLPPLAGSPVIDSGMNDVTNVLSTDQRGVPRQIGSFVDIGAVEGAITAPIVETDLPSSVTTNSAQFNGLVNPGNQPASYYFAFGLTTNYGTFTLTNELDPGDGSGVPVAIFFANLPARTVFHYQLIASNSLGVTAGADVAFHTGGLTNTVTVTNDSGAGSLRDILTTVSAGDSIVFATNLSGTAIHLTNGAISISTDVTIDASALPGGLRLDGGSNSCVLAVLGNAQVTLDALTITNGFRNSNDLAGGIYSEGYLTLNQCIVTGNNSSTGNHGAGIHNDGSMILNQCTVTGNRANGGWAAGIYSGVTLTLNQCVISSNAATGDGGGLVNEGTATIDQCTFSGNSASDAEGGGGAILNSGSLTLSRSLIVSNTAQIGFGGGVFNNGTMTGSDSTFTGNVAVTAGAGGAFYLGESTTHLYNCTVSGNTATNGGGIRDNGDLFMTNCIVAGNTPDDSTNGVNCLVNTNPKLAPLGNYGGFTLTMPPLPGSPALDAGSDLVTNLIATDQRGVPRLSGSHVDIGAVEIQVPTLAITSPAAGAVFTNLNLTATGTASHPGGVEAVFVKNTGGSFIEATTANSWATWSAPILLGPGQNIISAYAMSSNGYFSLTNSVTVELSLLTTNKGNKSYGQLVVQINPPGPASSPNRVVPNDNDKLILIGSHLALTAVPGRNQIFSNWFSGTSLPYSNTTSPTLRFVMASNMVVQANFVTNVFLSAAGSYAGLFAPADARQQTNSGFITFNITSTGAMSGRVNLAGVVTPISGKFTPAGVLTNVARRGHLPNLTTVLQLDFDNDLAIGSVSDGSFTSPLLANLNVFNAKSKATNFEGQYTLTIQGATNAAQGPFGPSVATVKISPTGAVSLKGNLADGTPVSASSAINQNGIWPLYVSLYRGKGSLWSWNQFATNQAPAAGPAPSWINGGNPVRTALYNGGFTNTNMVILGSAYSPTNAYLLTNSIGAIVLLSGGNLASNSTVHLAVSGAVNATNIVLTLTKLTGAVNGFFLNPSTGKKTKVTGVLLQQQQTFGGFFLGTNESGAFELAPRP